MREDTDQPAQHTHHLNAGSEWRLEAARPIAAAYAQNPKVAAVIVGGSTARGYADRYSDIEIGVFWHESPTDEDRRIAAEASGAEIHRFYPYDADYEVWEDALFIGRAAPDQPGSGVLVEIPHYLVRFMEGILTEVTEKHDPSEIKQMLLSAIVSAIPLHGSDLIEGWRMRLAEYPRGLAIAVIKRHAQIEFLWRSNMYLDRGNNLMLLYEMFVHMAKKLCHVVFALNHIYYPGLKWLYQYADDLRIAPPDFNSRLMRLFEAEPRAAAGDLRALVEETYNLIERDMPEIDVEPLRTYFRHRRQPWDEPPPS